MSNTVNTDRKIVDLASFLGYFKRAKFMSDYAQLSPPDAGFNYRCMIEGEEKGVQLTAHDYSQIAMGLERLIGDLKELQTNILIKAC